MACPVCGGETGFDPYYSGDTIEIYEKCIDGCGWRAFSHTEKRYTQSTLFSGRG
jgi:hypothetical protein